jgi:hypothetical protein
MKRVTEKHKQEVISALVAAARRIPVDELRRNIEHQRDVLSLQTTPASRAHIQRSIDALQAVLDERTFVRDDGKRFENSVGGILDSWRTK